jgi:serine/threonine protein phosphatase PrpC
MKVEFSALSDKGPVREENQDRYLVSDFTTTVGGRPAEAVRVAGGGKGVLLAVADGMGGHVGGAQAAQMALATLIAHLKAAPLKADPLDRLTKAIEMANTAVMQTGMADQLLAGMGTTLTAALLRGRSLYLGHVGDSRIYILRGSVLRPLTTDHNMLTKLMGIDADEARKRVGGNVLVQCIGGKSDEVLVESAKIQLCQGDKILLCSDGLHSVVDGEHIARLMGSQDLTETVHYLLEAALTSGTTDNVTVLLAEVKDEDLPDPKEGAAMRMERMTEVYFDKRSGIIRTRSQ